MSSRPQLRRYLGLPSLVIFGLAYMTPMIVYGTFGILSRTTHAAVPSAYLIALFAMLLTAISYGKMARRYPVSGSAYSYSVRAFGPVLGFFVGWTVLLDYLFLPMVIWLIGAAYLSDAFPHLPAWSFLLFFIISTTVVNIIGLRVASRINLVILALQLLVMLAFSLLLAMYCVRSGSGTVDLLKPLTGFDFSGAALVAGAAIASYSFLGFDAVSTLSEEAKDPKRTIPKAILWVTLIGGAIFVVTSYLAQLSFPNLDFANIDAASSEMALKVGGPGFLTIFLAILIFAQLASGIAAQASGSRLIFVMARDGALPALFSRLHRRHSTPAVAIVTTGLIGLIAIGLDVTTSTSFINFGAMLAFLAVNLAAVKQHAADTRGGHGRTKITGLLLPMLGGAANVFLLANLNKAAIILGLVWLAVGLTYLAFLTGFFTRPVPIILSTPDEA